MVPADCPIVTSRGHLTLPAGGKAVVAAAEAMLKKAGEREVSAGRKQ